MEIHWSKLGSVKAPQSYYVNGLGLIDVVQEDIDDARKLLDNCTISLLKIRTASLDGPACYQIVGFLPAGRSSDDLTCRLS